MLYGPSDTQNSRIMQTFTMFSAYNLDIFANFVPRFSNYYDFSYENGEFNRTKTTREEAQFAKRINHIDVLTDVNEGQVK